MLPGLAETSSSKQAEISETLRTVVRDADSYYTGQGSISFLDYPNAVSHVPRVLWPSSSCIEMQRSVENANLNV